MLALLSSCFLVVASFLPSGSTPSGWPDFSGTWVAIAPIPQYVQVGEKAWAPDFVPTFGPRFTARQSGPVLEIEGRVVSPSKPFPVFVTIRLDGTSIENMSIPPYKDVSVASWEGETLLVTSHTVEPKPLEGHEMKRWFTLKPDGTLEIVTELHVSKEPKKWTSVYKREQQ
jgi:hypothetical protein